MNLKHLIAKTAKAVAKEKEKIATEPLKEGDVVYLKPEVSAKNGSKGLFNAGRPWFSTGKGTVKPIASTNLNGNGGEKGLCARVKLTNPDGDTHINGLVDFELEVKPSDVIKSKSTAEILKK